MTGRELAELAAQALPPDEAAALRLGEADIVLELLYYDGDPDGRLWLWFCGATYDLGIHDEMDAEIAARAIGWAFKVSAMRTR